ncbi:NADH-quinone oxidoreductase subunit F, partial [bacterium]|nr:NADH-quinone oxidoreductase subunit F [candidate division CSSED10-310 bacterium]
MAKLTSREALHALRDELTLARDANKPCVTVCSGTGCLAYRAGDVALAFEQEIARRGLSGRVNVRRSGCHGFCERGPLVVIAPLDVAYFRTKVEDVPEIVERTLIAGEIVEHLLYQDPETGERITRNEDIPFYKYQHRILLASNPHIDPKNIYDYVAVGGYTALAKALAEMSPEDVVATVRKADLRGRGGGGFSAGRKWETTRTADGDIKYVVVNGDEGDPGAYMDRSLLEGNPHGVLEGLIIGAYAIGAHQGYIYVRQEYPLAVENA